MKKGSFEKEYRRLNTAQKEAVDSIEGPVMVIAGPGTGKTTILSLRIANILLKTDTRPDNILALTFTDSGVRAMRKKLTESIGSEGHKVGIYTFHSFCGDVIKQYPESFGDIIGASNATEVDRVKIVEEILENGEFEYIKPYGDPLYYVGKLLAQIRDVKREGYTPEDYAEFLEEKKKSFKSNPDLVHDSGKYKGEMKGKYKMEEKRLCRDSEFLQVYTRYQEKLRKEKKIDFEDMIIETVRVLESDSDILLTLQEQYQYILADEHQDANNAQNKILELLSNFHSSPNLFIVGDEKQAIFRFQGASLENFLYFKKLYPDTKLISLKENYRSTQLILDNAYYLIENNSVEDVLKVELESKTGSKQVPIKTVSFKREYDEIGYIIKDIKEKIKKGISPSEIAVVYRNNRDADELVRMLDNADLSYTIFSNQNILEHVDIHRFTTLLKAIQTISDDVYISEAMHIPYIGIDTFDIYKVLEYAKKNKKKIYEVLSGDLNNIELLSPKALKDFASNLSRWSKLAHSSDALSVCDDVMHSSGYLDDVLKNPMTYERLGVLTSFFDELKQVSLSHTLFTLQDLLSHLDICSTYNIPILSSTSLNQDGIRLMTAHKSKGLEFEHVYIFNAIASKWGGGTKRRLFTPILSDEVDDQDERRLFYVALTRAKKEVTVIHSETGLDGRENLPSQFISELKDELVEEVVGESVDISTVYKKERGVEKPTLHNVEYLHRRFLEQPFSVTALNNYLDCPWKYFYQNLVRLPSIYTKQQTYGVVIHQIMKELFDSLLSTPLSKKGLLQRFDTVLSSHSLDSNTNLELKNKGEKALGIYFDTYFKNSTPKAPLETEYKVFADFKVGNDLEVTLTGNLDKVEESEGGVAVVDYKTSKIKSRNDILGKTKNSNGNIFRQLVFYKLLLDRSESKYKMNKGVIDFLEPDDSGRLKKEVFEIGEEVGELEKTLEKVLLEIYNLDFWEKTCDDKECQFCKFRTLVK